MRVAFSMQELTFRDLNFEENGSTLVVNFLDHFYFEVERSALKNFEAHGNKLSFKGMSEEEARNKFNSILDLGFERLMSRVTKKPAFYINKYFGLPLIGSSAFGVVDRNSNMLELKPITGCNMNCVFCSVDEGLASRKSSELIIDKDYLLEEATKVIIGKNCDVHITINAHGEPTTYKPMPELIEGLSKIKNVQTISLITNCTLIDEAYVDRVIKAGLTRLNVSLNAFTDKKAKILEGHGKYDVEHAKRICKYAANKLEVVIAPVFVPGYNDDELKDIVLFAKSICAKVGIQNYLYYERGRNPANTKSMPWPNFYELLKKLEVETNFKLILDTADFGVVNTPPLPKPFKKGQTIEVELKCPGRYKAETIGVSKERNVTVMNHTYTDTTRGKKVKVLIISDKHNIFYGKVL